MFDESETLKNLQGEPERKRKREASSQTDEESNNSLVPEMQDGDDPEWVYLKQGIRNPETGIRNPESGIWKNNNKKTKLKICRHENFNEG